MRELARIHVAAGAAGTTGNRFQTILSKYYQSVAKRPYSNEFGGLCCQRTGSSAAAVAARPQAMNGGLVWVWAMPE